MTLTQVESAVAAWLNAVRGARALVKGRIGEAAAPAVPYLMYSVGTVELPDSIPVAMDVSQTARAPDTVVEVNISVVGDITTGGHAARNDATALVLSLRHSQRTLDIKAAAGVWGVSQVQNMSALEVGTLRQRYDLTVTLSVILTADAAPETIEKVTTGIYELTIPTQINVTEP